MLESRRLLAHFAVIGDFSSDVQTAPTRDVANLVKSWNPDFVATVGDNNYPDGSSSTIDDNIGQWYHQFIGNYKGSYGGGASSNEFWPAIGNHDYNSSAGYSPYLNYFTLPGNERYYTTVQGNLQLFVVNSDGHESDGTGQNSTQGQWLKNALAGSTAKWRLVIFHHPAYSSGGLGSNSYMQWPFQQWGASAVISGHDHDYERIDKGGFPYFVDGLGGESIVGFGSTVSGSQVRYNGDYGAMLIDTSNSSMTFQFITRSGKVIDSYTLGSTSSAPSAPSSLSASAQSSTQARLIWTDNSPSLSSSFNIERSTDGGSHFSPLASTLAGVTSYSDSGLSPGATYVYRVSASNSAGTSGYSNTASVTLPTGSTTFLSDMTWVSSTNGWGPVERDTSVGGSGSGDGNTITLNGVTYPKGLGAHALSTVVVNLNKQYGTFLSDVGVDDETGPGTVVFQVWGDGVKLYDSGTMTQSGATKSASVDVSNVTQLTLTVTDAGDGTSYDHADWAGARLQSSSPSQPPAAPTGLTALAVSPTEINLTWNDVSNESGFKVERSSDGTNFSQIGTTGAGVLAYSDTTVSGSSLYYYRVRATNASGDSAPSNVDSARPLQPPTAPSNLAASALSSTQINLTWTKNNNDGEIFYNVERSPDGVSGWTRIVSIEDGSAYSDISLAPATKYYYRVNASNLAGTTGYTNVASATTSTSGTTTAVTYIPTGSTWKYLDNGSNQGTAWRATSFSDSTWKSGAAQLGYGDGDEATVVSYGGNANNKYITTYFRKSFSVTDPTQVSGLTLRVLRDDGAVVYVNGTEVYRTNMPTGTIGYTTLASAAIEDNTYYSATFSNSLLVAGNNVIAVEIHQADATSSDISFDFELKANVAGGGSTTTAPAAPSGLAASAVSSSQINLTWTDNSNNESNFILERSPDGTTGWTQIATPAANTTSYSNTSLAAATKYFYRIRATNSAGDSANSATASATTQSSGTTTAVTVIPTGSTWKYLDNGSNQGTAWRATSFSDSTWKSGAAELGYGDGDEATVVSYGSNASNKYITTYFRKSFAVTDPSNLSGLTLRIKRDDGAVVYVNGTEVFRTNMPTGTIGYTTLASNAIEDETFYSATFSNSLLVAGNNVIAVEIHQADATSSDISFDFELKATQTSLSSPIAEEPSATVSTTTFSTTTITSTSTTSTTTTKKKSLVDGLV